MPDNPDTYEIQRDNIRERLSNADQQGNHNLADDLREELEMGALMMCLRGAA